MTDRDHESDEPAPSAARAVALVALLPVLVALGVVLALADLARAGEGRIRRWTR